MQLAIDTSTDVASLAVLKDRKILAELTWRCGQNHTVELYPRLDFLLDKAGQDIKSADCIFVARGPGSFNGLRVGVSAAKGLAFSLGIPIIGIGTLEATAYQHAETGLPVCVVQNAGREEIASARYQKRVRKGWSQIAPEQLTTVKALVKDIKEKTIFCGEFDEATILQIKKLFKNKAIISTPAGQLRRAAYLAELGWLRQASGSFDDVGTLQPLYLRKPPITERKKA
jgi:tRNA threonylcarbamoyl adenosine modification protein YeaZ